MHPTTTALTCLLATAISITASAGEPTQNSLTINEQSFGCIRDMTPVRGFYVDNLMGDLEGTLAVANSPTGGTYPPGSVVQLVPAEVMVKLPQGSSPPTRDWEFFELDVSTEGSSIRNRGFVDVVNRFGGNCFGCHVQAKPQWDLVCESNHGCEPIPLTRDILDLLQKTDPRCDDIPTLTEEERGKLQALQQALQAQDP